MNEFNGEDEKITALQREIKERAVVWKDLPRTTGEEQEAAEAYYEEQIMPLLADLFRLRERQRTDLRDRFKYLILPLGISYAPLVLSIIATQPSRVLILHTAESEALIDKVVRFTGLSVAQLEKRAVSARDPLEIYQAIKEAYTNWGFPGQIAVDFTGGTKAMSGGSAMAGAVIGAELIYIAGNYLREFRRPEPGTEYLAFIQNPYAVFGDLEEERALDLLARNDFATARQILSGLVERVPDPRRCQLLAVLTAAYEAWDNLNLEAAEQAMQQACTLAEQFGRAGSSIPLTDPASREIMRWQADRLSILRSRLLSRENPGLAFLSDWPAIEALMLTLYHNALRREQQGKYDMAALLLYRLLEIISQHRLALRGIETASPDYRPLLQEHPDLPEAYRELSASVDRRRAPEQLPSPIALVEGYVLLQALSDPLVEGLDLNRLNGQVVARNFSVFAHGYKFLTDRAYREFRGLVEDLLRRCLALMGANYSQLLARYAFLPLAEICRRNRRP